MPQKAVSEMYDDVVRAADDSGRGRAVVGRWALLVPWYTE